MEIFKNRKELEKQNCLNSLDAIPSKKISASELKPVEIELDKKSFWGIAVKANKEEVLIGCHPAKNHYEESVLPKDLKKLFFKASDELFINESKNFIKNCIDELFAFGFFKIVQSDKGFICLDIPLKPYSSYSLFTDLKQFEVAEVFKTSKERGPKRIEKFWLNFCEDLLFFQDVGPYDENEEKDQYKEVIEWAEKELDWKSLKQLHKDHIFEPYFFGQQSSESWMYKLWPVFEKVFIDDSDGSKAFKNFDTLLSELSLERASMVFGLAIKYKSLITCLYCVLQGKSASFFSTSVASLNRLTISNFMKEVIEDIEVNESEEESKIESYVEETQVDAILGAKEDFQAVQDFLTFFKEQENEFKEIIWEDEREGLEFKGSFRWDIHRKNHNPEMQYVVIKAICGLANRKGKRGGRLIIGIHKMKDGTPDFIGIEKDGWKKLGGLADTDKWERELYTSLENYTDTKDRTFLEVEFTVLDNKTFAVVDVHPTKPIGLYPWDKDKKDVDTNKIAEIVHRVGPRTVRATYEEASELVKERESI